MTDQELALMRNPPKRNARSPIGPETYERIRQLAEAGVTYRDLGKRFGIHRSSIAAIVKQGRI